MDEPSASKAARAAIGAGRPTAPLDLVRVCYPAMVAVVLTRAGALRDEVDEEEAARILFPLTSFELADALTVSGGWTHDQLESWLTRTIHETLLGPNATSPATPPQVRFQE